MLLTLFAVLLMLWYAEKICVNICGFIYVGKWFCTSVSLRALTVFVYHSYRHCMKQTRLETINVCYVAASRSSTTVLMWSKYTREKTNVWHAVIKVVLFISLSQTEHQTQLLSLLIYYRLYLYHSVWMLSLTSFSRVVCNSRALA